MIMFSILTSMVYGINSMCRQWKTREVPALTSFQVKPDVDINGQIGEVWPSARHLV